jgi:hypothetical protein
MTIEISEEKYWKLLNYYDGMLYLSLLNIDGKNDWRLFKDAKEARPLHDDVGIWYISDGNIIDYLLNTSYFWVVPVRDIC